MKYFDVIRFLDPNKAAGPHMISHKRNKIYPEKKIAITLQIIFDKSRRAMLLSFCMEISQCNSFFQKGSLFITFKLLSYEEFEDTKGVIRTCISQKNKQHNGQKKKYKRTNNDLLNIHIKLKIE